MANGILSVEYSFDYNGSNASSDIWHKLDVAGSGNDTDGYEYSDSVSAPAKSSGSNAGGYGYDIYPTAIGKGYVPVAIRVTDKAGNSTIAWAEDGGSLANSLKLVVKENTAPTKPTTTVTKIVADQKPTLTWTITDKSSGASGIKRGAISIDGGAWQWVDASAPTANGQNGAYTFSYTPTNNLSEATHKYKVKGEDYDGNFSPESNEQTFIVDITIPDVVGASISNSNLRNMDGTTYSQDPTDGALTNVLALTVNGGTITEANSVYARLKLNGVQVGDVKTNVRNPTWDVTLVDNSENTLVYEVYDEAYKEDPITYADHLVTISYSVTVDTIAPTISLAELGTAIAGSSQWSIKIKARDA